jgi:hypothetical protein
MRMNLLRLAYKGWERLTRRQAFAKRHKLKMAEIPPEVESLKPPQSTDELYAQMFAELATEAPENLDKVADVLVKVSALQIDQQQAGLTALMAQMGSAQGG